MGGTQTKEEEVIISQAGNSGGATNDVAQSQQAPLTALEVTGIVTSCILIALLAYLAFRLIKKAIEKKIKKEVSKAKIEVTRSYNVEEV